VYVYFRPLVGYSRMCRVRLKINDFFEQESKRFLHNCNVRALP